MTAGNPPATRRPFAQVDVFAAGPYSGNPLAVVLDGAGLSTEQMQRFANWTNLSETTFLLPPTAPEADYHVRIFTPVEELPFAGHPTLGSAHAWLADGGKPKGAHVVQECGAGLVRVRTDGEQLAFSAPPLIRSGPVDDALRATVVEYLRISDSDVVDIAWADNGPGWIAVLMRDAQAVLDVSPGFLDASVGIVGPHPAGSPFAFEVRGFFPKAGSTTEDPVTGSLNASLAQWLLSTGRAAAPYVARQGTAIGRDGRVSVSQDEDGTIWVGGASVTSVTGEVRL
ncbi:PhzF family phenazine biosynthesis protein [Actinomycetes bacterium KLBMP 9759]